MEMDADMNDVAANAGAVQQPAPVAQPTDINPMTFQHHTLRFECPAIELLPPDTKPFLEEPRGVGDREEPDCSRLGLGLSINDLDFFVRFQTIYGLHDGDLDQAWNAGKEQQPLNLPAAIEQLRIWAGTSVLKFVSYIDEADLTIITLLQLETTIYTRFGKIQCPAQDFELEKSDIAQMLRTTGKQAWVRQFDDLLHARSDRAYLSRQQRLAEWDQELADEEQDSWLQEWDGNDLVPPRQVFANCLAIVTIDENGHQVDQALGDLDDLGDAGFDVKTPCGHYCAVSKSSLKSMTAHDIIYAVCDICDERIMGPADLSVLHYYYDRARRYRWEDKMASWVPKCKKIRNTSSLVEVDSEKLTTSLHDALRTFKLPISINPKLLCPTAYPETKALFDEMVEKLKVSPQIPAMTPKSLFENLEKLAWQLLGEMIGDASLIAVVLPPGFADFLTRWMTRTVNNAVGSQAASDSDEDVAVLMEKFDRTKIDPKAIALDDDFDDILKQIGQTYLGAEERDVQGRDADDDEEL